jgi:hypothetical protein
MGYSRRLYIGPVIRLKQPENKIAFYHYFDTVSKNFDREDFFQVLQRHCGGCRKGEVWIGVSDNRTECVTDDPAYLISEMDIEKTKNAFAHAFAKEIKILEAHYDSVVIDWAVVIDGS